MRIWLCSIFITSMAIAQVPDTEIFLFRVEKKDTVYVLKNPLNISHRKGYDNQPIFNSDDKSILYVSIDSSNQADVLQYLIAKKQTKFLTKTEVSEYSPTIIPDGTAFTCVVVEKDSTQRIWKYGLDGTFQSVLDEATDSVGYYTWLNPDSLLYYKLTNPHSLRVLDIKNQTDKWLCNNPTRAFKIINYSLFMYVIKDSTSTEFRIYNPILRESKLYCVANAVYEDFVWHPNFGLVISDVSNLKHYNEKTQTWEVLFSFSEFGIKKITRFNFDSKTKQLVVVSHL